MGEEATARAGGFRRMLHRLAADDQELQAEELQHNSATTGGTPVVRCQNRELVCVSGILRTVTLRPLAGAPSLQAQLYDGSGAVELVWLGRRRIAGIEPGRELKARGRLTIHDGRRAIYNPDYELLG